MPSKEPKSCYRDAALVVVLPCQNSSERKDDVCKQKDEGAAVDLEP